MAHTKAYDKALKELIDYLTVEGEKVIKDAYRQRGYRNQTYNLHDSYGSAVYQDGRLLKHTIRYVGKEKAKSMGRNTLLTAGQESDEVERKRFDLSGREDVNAFFEGYKPKTKKGLELVVIAAMVYASYLEIRHKYQVISSAVTGLSGIAKELEKKLGGKIDGYEMNAWRNEDALGVGAYTIRGEQKVI